MPHSKFMKILFPATLLTASLFIVGCDSLDNPLSGLLRSGHDERVYNSQTGEFEWPKDSKKRPSNPRPAGAATGAVPAPERKGDGRYYDTQKSQWVEAAEDRESAPKPRSKPAAPAPVLRATPVPVGTPPPVRPPRARGIYNPSTGQIEWNDFDPAPTARPQAEKKKSWYWPF